MNEKRTYVCKRARLCSYLMERGFDPYKIKPADEDPRFNVYLFTATPELYKAVTEYVSKADERIQADAQVDAKEKPQNGDDAYTPQYSIVVQFTNSGSRGFLIAAKDKRQAMEKLMDKLGENNIACMDSIHIGFVYMDEDIIS